MPSIERHNGGYRVHIYFRSKRRTLWLGKTTLTHAREISKHLANLMDAAELACGLPGSTERWVASIGPKMRKRVIAAGILGSAAVPSALGQFIEYFIGRNAQWADSTKVIWKGLGEELKTFFGADRQMASITEADAEDCANWFRSKGHSRSHSGKQIQNAKQLFTAAVRARVIYSNPFHSGIDCSQPIDQSRKAYVSEEVADKLIAAADAHMAAVIAMARYAGVRVPSEILGLQWEDIHWKENDIRIRDKKRSQDRTPPLFTKLRPALEAWQKESGSDSGHVFTKARASAAKTYRDELLKLIDQCGLKKWDKLWHTLRASRETDLKERMPGRSFVSGLAIRLKSLEDIMIVLLMPITSKQ